ncbi:hypothetical protein [Salegentibacter salarius]|uniref:Uncharacterized protein n=1 Tax=Salegentibacter salarius TaxID=435906 RepID=A0A2N0TPE7_9FLAO|nr:hypothetical protein [Salegentibacter salarius]OEY71718.1 hypothetical protein BHS39_15100 [Salegentibacter salarius]PKD16604.1 hypothetical protein APR40_15070 [Salegentibacter salarius]SLK06592.1 hypothetical protein SAMN05660445_03111 [Salegentibacter salarius]
MKNKLILLVLLLTSLNGLTQEPTEKEFVILTFEMDRNKDSHGTFVYYWIAELEKYEKVDEYKEPKISSLFLHEFYGSEQLESCCLGKVSYPYTMTTETEFNFPDNYSDYLTDLRALVKKNRKKIQVIKKEWQEGYREEVRVYATAIRGKLCECEFGGNTYLTTGDQINFPKGEYEVLDDFLTKDKNILLFKDFSAFDFSNTDYRTGK